MGKIRTVKPDLFRHESLFEAEQKTKLPLRLAFISLFTCCDREGRFRWIPRLLKLDMLPYDEINFSEILDALAAYGFVIKYHVNDDLYGYIPSWKKHQRINLREPASTLPDVIEATVVPVSDCIHKKYSPLATPCAANSADAVSSTCIAVQGKTKASMDGSINVNLSVDHENNSPKIIENTNDTLFFTPHNSARACTWGSGREVEVEVEMEMEEEMEREVEGDCQGGTKSTTLSKSCKTQNFQSDPVQEVFAYWKTTMGHSNAKLDRKRKTMIGKALQWGYGVEQLCEAISGCASTPHNIGLNDRGQRYDGLHIILRDADQIDRFIHNYQQPPKMLNAAQKREQGNVAILQNWLNKKSQRIYAGECQ